MVQCFNVLIPHCQTGEILAYSNLQLPKLYYDGDSFTDLWKLCRRAEELLSDVFKLFLLRAECESFEVSETDYDQKHDINLLIFEIVSTGGFEVPPGFCWVKKGHAARITLDPHVACVANFLHNYTKFDLSETNDRMYPYSVQGWFNEASTWIRKECTRHRLRVSQVVQATRKAEGCVLKSFTDQGQCLYFKEVGQISAMDEIRVTEVLSEAMPHVFPKLLSVDRERKWMLMQDQGQVFGDKDAFSVSKNPDRFRFILTEWGNIQRSSISQVNELRRKGLEIVEYSHLKERVMKMMADAEWLSLCLEEGEKIGNDISIDLLFVKEALLNCIIGLGEKISQYRVPLSLVHGDLDPGNIIISDKREVKLIDLGSTCLSYPFRDAVVFSEICDADEKDLEFYFDMWSEYGTVEDLRELYQAVVGLEMVFSCEATYRCYAAVERSRESSRRKAANAFAVLMIEFQTMLRRN